MVVDETQKIINSIKNFRPFFQNGNSKKEELEFLKSWQKVFEPYTYEDVSKNLNNWFKTSSHFGRTPDPYELIQGLLTETEKNKLKAKNQIIIKCPLCNVSIGLASFDKHYSRCSSLNYILINRKKYFKKETTYQEKEKLKRYTDEEFNEVYVLFLKQIKKYVSSADELKCINKILSFDENKKIIMNL